MFTIIFMGLMMVSVVATLIAVAACIRCGQVECRLSSEEVSELQAPADSTLRLVEHTASA